MRRWRMATAMTAAALLTVAPGRAQAPGSVAASGRPDVLVLVYQQAGRGDLVNITYAHTVPHAQAQRDLAALAQATGWAVGPGHVTDGAPPVQNKQDIGPMTSSTLSVPGVIQDAAHTLPVEPFVTAFRPYKRLALIFSVGPQFQFQGPRDFADNNVQIAMQQHGTVFTYQVRILNPAFSRLNLPQSQVTTGTAPHRAAPWVLLLGVLAAAAAAGVLVYIVMARKTPPPPGVNTDALAEERTKIGTRG